MTQHNTMNVKLSTSQLDKWKSEIKNNTEVKFHQMLSVILMMKVIKLSLTNTHVSRLRKAFANNSSASIKLSKTQLQKIWQSGGLLGRLLGSLLRTGLSLIRNVIKPLVKSIVIPLGLTAAASATDFHKKMFGSGTTTLIISMEEMNDITKIA